jgi:glycerophosphoryl diester phosphodiesterase
MTLTTYISADMLVIGHRGACGYEPENTLISFSRALDMGVKMIELDVYVCKTGELVITHDDDVSITTNGYGKVVDMTFCELRKLKVKGTAQIPTLQEVIELVDHRIPINIELKGPGTAKPVADLLKNYLAKGWSNQDFIISSFDHNQVSEFKKLHPNIKTGVLFSWRSMPTDITYIALKHHANFIGLDVKVVTKSLVKQAHDASYPVYVWTVNDKKTADMMRTLQVDGIFSNYPDCVRHSS